MRASLWVTDPALKKFLNSSQHLQKMSTVWVVGLRLYMRF